MKINKLIDKYIEDDVDVMKVHIDVLYEYAKEYNELKQKINKATEYIKNHKNEITYRLVGNEEVGEMESLNGELLDLLEILGGNGNVK